MSSVLADELKLPSGLVQIENEAFMGDTSLDIVILPNGVKSIGDKAFANSSIKRIYLPESITYIGNNAFYGCNNIIGYGLEGTYASEYFKMHSIPFEAEWNASPLGDFSFKSLSSTTCEIEKYIGSQTSIIIPKVDGTGRKVVSIGESAFYNNKKISNVAIPDTVLVIKAKAFMGCESIFEFSFPDSIVSFEDYAFYGCSSLRNVNIPESLTEIGWAAFFNCNFVFSFTVPENNPHFSALDGVLFNKDKTELIRYPAGHNRHTYTIPDSVIIIGDDAFRASSALKDIIIPEGVKTIGYCSFYNCYGLENVHLPDSITTIKNCAFSYCYLSEINLPRYITEIDDNSFEYNPDLNVVVFKPSYAYNWAIDHQLITGNVSVEGGFDIPDMYVEQYDPISTTYSASVSAGWIKEISIYCTDAQYYEAIQTPFQSEHISEYHGEWTVPPTIRKNPGNYLVEMDIMDNHGLLHYLGSLSVSVVEYNSEDVVILQQPQTQYIYQNIYGDREPSKATLKVIAENVSSYQWFGLTDEGWKEIKDSTSDTFTCGALTVSLRTGLYGEATFCCKLIGNNGTTEYTNAASVRLFVDNISLDIKDIELNIGEKLQLNATVQTDRAYNQSVRWVSSNPNVAEVDSSGIVTAKGIGYTTITAYAADNGGSADTCFVVVKELTSDFSFENIDDTYCKVTGYNGNAESITIPSKSPDGHIVNTVGASAFAWYYHDGKPTTEIIIPNTITVIEDEAFRYFDGNLVIPDSIVTIGESAFRGCHGLAELHVPESCVFIGDYAFRSWENATSIYLPEHLQHIGAFAFENCSAVTTITIPDSVTYIGEGAFYNCGMLEAVYIPEGVSFIGANAFTNCGNIVIHGKTNSYAEIFARENNIPFVDDSQEEWHPSPLSDFEFSALSGTSCKLIKYTGNASTVVIPSQDAAGRNVIEIEPLAFKNCSSVKYISIPNTVIRIEYQAFCMCAYLESIDIPSSVKGIISGFVYSCPSMQSINVSNQNKYYTDVDGVLYTADKTQLVYYPSGREEAYYSIHNNTASIESDAFHGAVHLENILIPSSVKEIGAFAFADCTSLLNLTIPSGVTEIYQGIFYDCHSLEYVSIPEYVTSLGPNAFRNCYSINELKLPNTIIEIDHDVFRNCSNLVLLGYVGSYAEGYAYTNNIPFKAINDPTYQPEIFLSFDHITSNEQYIWEVPINISIFIGMNLVGETDHDVYPTVENPLLLLSVPDCCENESMFTVSTDDTNYQTVKLNDNRYPGYTHGIYLNKLSGTLGLNDQVTFRIHCSNPTTSVHNTDHIIKARLVSSSGYSADPIEIHISSGSLNEAERDLYQHIVHMCETALPPDDVIGVMKDESFSIFDRMVFVAEDIANFNFSDLLIPANKVKYLYWDALKRADNGKNIEYKNAELVPTPVKVISSGGKLEQSVFIDAFNSMCDPKILETIKNKSVESYIKKYFSAEISESDLQTTLTSLGMSSNDAAKVLKDTTWLNQLNSAQEIISGISTAQKVINNAIEVMNQIEVMKSLDNEKLREIAYIYLQSNDLEMKIVGSNLLTIANADFATRVALIAKGKLAEFGMNFIMDEVAKAASTALAEAAGGTFVATIKLTNATVNWLTGAGSIPKKTLELNYASTAVKESYSALTYSCRAYEANPSQDSFRKMYYAYINYHEVAAKAEEAFVGLYKAVGDSPGGIILITDEMKNAMKNAQTNAAAMKYLASVMKARYDLLVQGNYEKFREAIDEITNNYRDTIISINSSGV